MSEPNVGQLLQGGGLLAFAAAVWYAIRKVERLVERAVALLERLDERSKIELEAEPPARAAARRRVRTNPHGVRVRRLPDTNDPTEPG